MPRQIIARYCLNPPLDTYSRIHTSNPRSTDSRASLSSYFDSIYSMELGSKCVVFIDKKV